jgi:hypothetical protein
MSKELNIGSVQEKIEVNDIDTDSRYLEHVKSYKYLLSIVNGDNSIEDEITERIALGSKS